MVADAPLLFQGTFSLVDSLRDVDRLYQDSRAGCVTLLREGSQEHLWVVVRLYSIEGGSHCYRGCTYEGSHDGQRIRILYDYHTEKGTIEFQ